MLLPKVEMWRPVVTCLLRSLALYCISLRTFTVSQTSLAPPGVLFQSGGSCKTTVLDLEWGPDVHPEMWKLLTSSAGTDLKLDLQQWWWQL